MKEGDVTFASICIHLTDVATSQGKVTEEDLAHIVEEVATYR